MLLKFFDSIIAESQKLKQNFRRIKSSSLWKSRRLCSSIVYRHFEILISKFRHFSVQTGLCLLKILFQFGSVYCNKTLKINNHSCSGKQWSCSKLLCFLVQALLCKVMSVYIFHTSGSARIIIFIIYYIS